MTMASLLIRPATVLDAPQIARVHVESWRTGYADIVPAVYLDKLSIKDKTQFWESILGEKESNILVAVSQRTSEHILVGFTGYGEPTVDDGERRAELRVLYVSPATWSQGIGRQLCQAVFEKLAQAPNPPSVVHVEVYAQNIRAVKFYKQLGFEKTGEGRTDPAGTNLATVHLSKKLGYDDFSAILGGR